MNSLALIKPGPTAPPGSGESSARRRRCPEPEPAQPAQLPPGSALSTVGLKFIALPPGGCILSRLRLPGVRPRLR